MVINGVVFNCDLMDILVELQSQLNMNGIKLLQKIKDGPDNIQVQCPYHKDGQERRPSAGIRKSDGMFHCFGCGETHTLPGVISHCFGQDSLLGSYGFGYNWLLKNFVSINVEERKDVNLDFNRTVGNIARNNEQVIYVSEEELDSYRYYHPYWKKRGIDDEYIIELFDLGYDKETDCITFPVRDINGNCLFVAKRSVKTKFFNYPEGVEKPLYGLYEMSKFWKGEYRPSEIPEWQIHAWVDGGEVVVTESMLDALSFWQVGKYAVALNGTGNELQFQQLRELPCRELILATDMDSAGIKARICIKQKVKNKIIKEYFFPNGKKDANECTKEELRNLREYF